LSAGGEALAPVLETSAAGVRTRTRLTYTKLGRARFIGSLELATLFYRAARRAGLPLAFSQGHHPLPRFAFGPALPVGVESDCEVVDIDLLEPWSAADVRAALSGELPEGMTILAAETVSTHAPSIASSIAALRYEIDVNGLINGNGDGAVRARIAAFNQAGDFPVTKFSKGTERVINARPFVSNLELNDAGIVDATILSGTTGSLKPTVLVTTLLGLDAATASTLRVRKVAALSLNAPACAGPSAAATAAL